MVFLLYLLLIGFLPFICKSLNRYSNKKKYKICSNIVDIIYNKEINKIEELTLKLGNNMKYIDSQLINVYLKSLFIVNCYESSKDDELSYFIKGKLDLIFYIY